MTDGLGPRVSDSNTEIASGIEACPGLHALRLWFAALHGVLYFLFLTACAPHEHRCPP